MADKRKTVGPSACKQGLWGKKTKENNATMPLKPRLHALGPIVSLHVRHLWIWRMVSNIIRDSTLKQLIGDTHTLWKNTIYI